MDASQDTGWKSSKSNDCVTYESSGGVSIVAFLLEMVTTHLYPSAETGATVIGERLRVDDHLIVENGSNAMEIPKPSKERP